jgi:hypothetical protein
VSTKNGFTKKRFFSLRRASWSLEVFWRSKINECIYLKKRIIFVYRIADPYSLSADPDSDSAYILKVWIRIRFLRFNATY